MKMENKRKEEIIKKWEESGLLNGLTEMDKDHPMLGVIETIGKREINELPDVKSCNSNKIRLEKLDIMGKVIETIELEGRWKITTGDKSYFMTNRYVDEMKVDLEKIQKNFIDNL
jgi:hypothetical protein